MCVVYMCMHVCVHGVCTHMHSCVACMHAMYDCVHSVCMCTNVPTYIHTHIDTQSKGTFIYSAVSSPWDYSKRFTLHPWQTYIHTYIHTHMHAYVHMHIL